MSRKSRRTLPQTPPPEAPQALPRYRPLARRTVAATAATQTDFTDEAQYIHVRRDLLRIGILAASLFGFLVLLRLLWPYLEPLWPQIYAFLRPLLSAVRI